MLAAFYVHDFLLADSSMEPISWRETDFHNRFEIKDSAEAKVCNRLKNFGDLRSRTMSLSQKAYAQSVLDHLNQSGWTA